MRSSKSVIVGLSIVACFLSAIPGAHAGGGMGTGGTAEVTAPMSCRVIVSAPNQPHTVSIVDGFTDTGDAVKVGAAVLYCQPAIATRLSGPVTSLISAPDSITCYNLGGADQAKETVSLTDPFGQQTVVTGGISVFCVPAVTGAIGQ